MNITAVALAAAALLLGGCDSKSTQEGGSGADGVEISLSASPQSVGVNLTTVIEAALTTDGNPLSGQEVTFEVQPSSMGSFAPASAATDGSGVASTVFSAEETGTALLTASAEVDGLLYSTSTSVEVTNTGEPAGTTINSIYLAADSINLVVKSTGGIEIAMLHAIGYDRNGNPVPEDQAINFIITDGPGGGEHLDTAGYGPYTVLTNENGKASLPLHSGTRPGTIRIRAYADTILSNAAQIMVSAGPPAYIVVGAQNCNVDYWDDVAEFNDIVAVVSDVYHNPVNDSTVVYFTTDEGTMKSHEERTSDLEGIATTRWISGNNVPTCDGDVLVIAETAGGTVIDTSMFFNTHFPDTLIATGVPSTIPANSKSEVYVWVTGLDLNDNPVIGGTKFLADATYLKVSGGSLEDGCYSASDRVVLQSAVLEQDYSLTGGDDDGIGAVDVVTYWHPAGAASSFSVTMTTGTTYSGNSSMSVQGSPKGGDIAYFTIVVKDRAGNPLGDHTMDLGSGTVETNTYGEAYFSAQIPLVPGDYTYTATDTDPRGNGVVLSTTVSVEDE